MKIQLVRNATLVVHYAGKKFLIDPFLAEKGVYPPFPNSLRQDQNNPLVGLPLSIDDMFSSLDAVIVTHLHLDHWDDAAKEALPKDIPLFVQNEEDAEQVRSAGFQKVIVLQEDTVFEDIRLTKTKGEHGRGEILQLAGQVCGVIFNHSSEKTLYIAGDTVWYEEVRRTIEAHKPDVIVVNGGDNQFLQGGSLVMGKEDILQVHQAAPDAAIISVHMEAVNHWTLSREELRSFANEKGMSAQLLVPADGEAYSF
ncbi:MBL fold metallo-hydrolase [Paenibacillus soyae]|uniref:MBL fold metallo-hydrolase n=1 Tax=Paenibacillus soyae TaxID=2969249 RepID=A0A9X2MRQ3_9BACL|nr:MBL fold metallo-hydrolase [Paenibacillus soyae]MCR2807073.1 MBL fold metallo-hydrolase [Paenibacillus soyae]